MPLKAKNDLHKDCQTKMGAALGDLFFLLWQDLSWLNFTYSEFKQLFASGTDHVHLMKSSARDFFALVERLLWQDLFLGLCRITDPPRSASKDNLTVQRLPGLINESSLKVDVQDLVNQSVNLTQFARDWRNRQIGHRDLLKAMNPTLHPLSSATRQDLDASITAPERTMNKVELFYLQSTTSFGMIRAERGANELMYHLRSLQQGSHQGTRGGAAPNPAAPPDG